VIEGAYTTREVCERTGFSYRQLTYWITRGYLTPSHRGVGKGSRHLFSGEDVAALIALRDSMSRVFRVPPEAFSPTDQERKAS